MEIIVHNHLGASRRTAASKGLPLPLAGKPAATKDGVGVLLIDERGAIVNCSPAAAAMFSCSRYDLENGTIWSLFSDMAPNGRPDRHRDGRIGHLRDDGGWQRFNAVNVYGHDFPIDVAMLQAPLPGDRKLFEMRLRHAPGA